MNRNTLGNATLEGKFIQLEPYDESKKEAVRLALNCDAQAWDLFSINGRGSDFEKWWSSINHQIKEGTWIAYAIRDKASHQIVGTSSFLNIKPQRQCLEIGATFLQPEVRSGYVNPEAKLLMLEHAFQHGMRRIELLTDLRNERSQAALTKIGAVREGIMRRDRITWTGHIRDSVLFAVTDLDWAHVRERLKTRLNLHEKVVNQRSDLQP